MNNMFRYKFKNINKTIAVDLDTTLNSFNTVEIEQISSVIKSILFIVDNMIKEEIDRWT